jgi:hypothetical protein
MVDEQTSHSKWNAVSLIGGDAPFPKRLRNNAEHRAAIESLASSLNCMDRQ